LAISRYEEVGRLLRDASADTAKAALTRACRILMDLSERLRKKSGMPDLGHVTGYLRGMERLRAYTNDLHRLVQNSKPTFEDAEAICLKSRLAWLGLLPALLDLAVSYDDLLYDLGAALQKAQIAVLKTMHAQEEPKVVSILKHYHRNICRRAELVQAFPTKDKSRFIQKLKDILSDDSDAN